MMADTDERRTRLENDLRRLRKDALPAHQDLERLRTTEARVIYVISLSIDIYLCVCVCV